MQIATDSLGDVYLPNPSENDVLEYSPTGTLLKTFTGGPGPLKEPTGVAVDASGNLWIADNGDNRIEKLSPADSPIGEIKSTGVESLALDGHGDVFAIVKNDVDFCGSVGSVCSHLVEYSSAGAQLADVGAGSFENGSPKLPPMVAVDEASGRVYVTDAANKRAWIFGPPTAPVIGKELTSQVTSSEVKLGALVDPGGIAASYRFEYLSEAAFQADKESFSGPEQAGSVPFPEGSVGEGLTSRAVWATASGLAPGTIYHYRVVATNEVDMAVGAIQTFTTETAAQAACPNKALRGGFSSRLPDCRAYELVTPPTTTSVQVRSGGGPPSADGNSMPFITYEPLPEEPTGGDYYMAARGEDGWKSEDLIPLEAYAGTVCTSYSTEAVAYSAGPSRALISFGHDSRASEPGGSQLEKQECNAEGLQVVSGEPVGYQNLLMRDNATGTYELVNAPPSGVTPADANFKGASADLSHIVFSEHAPLTSNAPPGVEDLYEWDEGALRLLTVLPDESPAQGSLVEANSSPAISADGSHVFFTSGGALYVRIDGDRTVQVDESEGPGPSGGGSFSAMGADGSNVFFTDDKKLTSDSTAEAGKPDLYECEIVGEGQVGETCRLTDLTVAKAGEQADVLRVSELGSQDSSHLYFLAKGVLAANKREYTNSEGHMVVEEAKSGEDNLYAWSGGTTTFIATLGVNDSGAGVVSPDGGWFAFGSSKSLTGYDNTPSNGGPVDELFLYEAASQQLKCASCNPTGETPIAGTEERTLSRQRCVRSLTGAVCSSTHSKHSCHPTPTAKLMSTSTRTISLV